ncbi:uncharacterized protein BDZ99DRAFT_570162 [Mytilinidion resinicola]|uniref:Uncharacterized protein n=1 Tax=Mytilinidion resinicola TaxID=574789 RepID=A0A6A6YPQ7_9PEZI|nr:uncharacterized protein BDZ99DRAFT_570162 [Mytilinidion resinicola]KAF2810862.1 hypothetical protein BDZ99DRAFT_570162 [Mytilinidion resinicola]
MQPTDNNFRYSGHTARGNIYRPNPTGASDMREARARAAEARIRQEAREQELARRTEHRLRAYEDLTGRRDQMQGPGARRQPAAAPTGNMRAAYPGTGAYGGGYRAPTGGVGPSWMPTSQEREGFTGRYAAPAASRGVGGNAPRAAMVARGLAPAVQPRNHYRSQIHGLADLSDEEVAPPYNPFRNMRSEMVDSGRMDWSGAQPVRGLDEEVE